MANLIDLTSTILSQKSICFETKYITHELFPVPIQNAHFGIFEFSAITSKETSDELDFLFMVDCSGSMGCLCSDKQSKMQHIIHTLKNIITFLYNLKNVTSNITINAFDTKIHPIVSRTLITSTNIDAILLKINSLTPRSYTNIELALTKSREDILQLQQEFPNNNINHIFMTDGTISKGSNDITILKSIICPDINNAFIGFGIEHDSHLLHDISSVGKSAYYFIDKIESSGLVYGEILHKIVYKVLTDVTIFIDNGLIYNYKTNSWEKSLDIADIVSESNKTFNIIASNPIICNVVIQGSIDNLVVLFPVTHMDNTDLSIQFYRQRTLQVLYEVGEWYNAKANMYNEFAKTIGGLVNNINTNMLYNQYNVCEKKLKEKLTYLIEEMKTYMKYNNMRDNKILKNLCDDIYICFKTLGTQYGSMFCKARHISQGEQRLYAVSNIVIHKSNDYDVNDDMLTVYRQRANFIPPPPTLQRLTNDVILDDDVIIDDDDVNYDNENTYVQHYMSDFSDTPYLTPQATQVMREINGDYTIADF